MKEMRGAPHSAVKKLRITLTGSPISCVPAHRATVKALGLRKLNAVVEHNATPAIVGMVRAVSYLLDVEEIS
jgi:large subunit ribosomal protein L30